MTEVYCAKENCKGTGPFTWFTTVYTGVGVTTTSASVFCKACTDAMCAEDAPWYAYIRVYGRTVEVNTATGRPY